MSIKAEKNFSLKDQLFNEETLAELTSAVSASQKGFQKAKFTRQVLAAFPDLELKARISHIVDVLEDHLPDDFNQAVDVLTASLPAPLDPTKTDDDFGKFIWIVPGEYVARHGCTPEHLDRSLTFLREATKRFSSEGAIRPFLKQFNAQSMAFVHQCAVDDNYHVRRLASEGIRPFLPWAPRADVAVPDIIEVLDKLYFDQTRYVTRSVANTLNDISKIDPDLVVKTLAGWQKAGRQNKPELQWLIRHALRTQLKEDQPKALALMGYAAKPAFSIKRISVPKSVTVGEDFVWQCQLLAQAKQKLKVTLKIYFLKSNGTHSAKVFAIKDGQFKSGDVLQIAKKQSFKPITTRTMYPGTHHAELIVNGVVAAKRAFELKT